MSRWKIMLEAALLYIGGISIGGFGGYRVAAELRGETRIFKGDDAIISLAIIAAGVVFGPFALGAAIHKWRTLNYPILCLCGVIVLIDLGWLVRELITK